MATQTGVRKGTVLATSLDNWGARPALCTAAGAVSYEDLGERVADAAGLLGASPRLVLVEAAPTVDAVVALLAALAGGHPALVVAPGERERRDGIVDRYRPDVVCVGDDGWHPRELHPGSAHDLHPSLALLLSTSGSTGSPKLVRLSAANVDSNAAAIGEYLALTPDDRGITTLPLHYCYGLSVLTSHLAHGASVALTDTSVVDPCFWEAFHRHGPTGLAGVPHTFDLLDRVGFASMETPTLRYVTQAGGRMGPDQVVRYATLGAARGWDLFVMYGQTEATARMAYLPPELARSRPTAIGRPIPGGALRVAPVGAGSLARSGSDVAPGEVGELVYSGPNVMLGYAEGAADLALGRTVDELWTGDLARRSEDGLYEVVGRRNRFLKVFGLRIDLDQVEAALRERGVVAVCTGDDQRLVVGVESGPGGVPAPAHDEVAAMVRGPLGLPPSAVSVVGYERLPRLASGKVDLQAVARAGAPAPAPDPGDPSTSVAAVFGRLLGIDAVEETDTFVGLGGDSLSYVEASVALERLVGTPPPDWHVVPVGSLEALVRSERRPSRLARVDTTVVLRALAIVLVVSRHLGMAAAVAGGAHVLFAVSGFNLARFQLSRPAGRARRRALFTSVGRVAVPSVLWLSLVALVNGKYGVADVLLVDDIFVAEGEPYWRYWFVEALVQVLFVVALLYSIPGTARLDRRHPLAIPVALLALVSCSRLDLPALDAAGPWAAFMGPVLICFLLGWIAQRAAGPASRIGVSVAAVALVPGLFVNGQRDLAVTAALVALVWLPTLPVPRATVPALRLVAGASLWIYLTHWQVYPVAEAVLPPVLALPVVLAAGVGMWRVAEWVTARVRPRRDGAER
ncbi:MAG: AMP-binding protein [Acidimicrobiales bacterium]|nr:AMP-binding protein [Acidimicrobiales bacterium]